MDRITAALGEGDEDVMNLRAAIAGLTFEGWSDEDLAAGVVEMARDCREELKKALSNHKTEQAQK